MKTKFLAIALAFAALACALPMGAAHAQATRTWVSGVGDDANPCSRTAPCKTFAGAISKTAAGGIINCLDPGGFGAVTITKTISIKCVSPTQSGITSPGTNAITVNALATDVVDIEDLSLEGTSTGLAGIKVLQVGALHVRHVTIHQFQSGAPNGIGILFAPSNATTVLDVTDSTIRDNLGGAILIQPGPSTTTVRVAMQNVAMFNNAFGVKVDLKASSSPAAVTGGISDSIVNGVGAGGGPGVSAVTTSTGSVDIAIDRANINNNNEGVSAKGASAIKLRVTNSILSGNAQAFFQGGSGLVYTYGDNQIDGNASPGTSTTSTLH